jgi:putative transposase
VRNVEDVLDARGIDVSQETVWSWWHRFGPKFGSEIRKRRIERIRSSRWHWYLDEVFVRIGGDMHYLWRAVDHEGEVLESYVTKTRDKKADLKFFRKAMRKHGRPEAIVTDKIRSYAAAMREIGAGARQETDRWANNRAENSHLPFGRRERAVVGCLVQAFGRSGDKAHIRVSRCDGQRHLAPQAAAAAGDEQFLFVKPERVGKRH